MTAAFGASLLWAAFSDEGMLYSAQITSGGSTFSANVGFTRPDTLRLDGMTRSTDYEIEYQAADAPTLAEGDSVAIDGTSYRVRSAPFVSDIAAQGMDGTWRRALLTKV